MPRPISKEELARVSSVQFDNLWKLIDTMSEEEIHSEFSFGERDKNVRDVLVHLYEWHQLLLNWVKANKKGDERQFLPEPYNWKTYPKMNIEFWGKHQNTRYEDAKEMFKKSHSEVSKLIDLFSDDELFKKEYFPWTGTTSLGSYCVSATSSHYDWAMKEINKHIKMRRKSNK